MSLTTRVGLLAGASALTLTGVSFAGTPAEDQGARIAELEAKVAQLTGENWLTESRADQVRGLIQDVLADADTRASLLQSGMTAGYDNGFTIGSGDGNFSLTVNGQLQARFVWNNQDTDNTSKDQDRWGFENSRTKLKFSGNVGADWGYVVEGNFIKGDKNPNWGGWVGYGKFDLDDAYISHNCGNGWTAMFGQFKAPTQREWLVSSANQLAVERSNLASLGGLPRVQGFAADYRGDTFHFTGGISNGVVEGRFEDWDVEGDNGGALWFDNEFAITARAEFLLSGTWDQFNDFTSPMGSEQGMMAGVAGHYQKTENGNNTDTIEFYELTADFSYEADGWNLFAAATMWNMEDQDDGDELEMLGFVVQGGYYFQEDFEGFARWASAELEDDGYDMDAFGIITVGVNKYYSPNVKWTTDVGYGLDPFLLHNPTTGWREDWDDEEDDGQIVFRTQWQLTF
jgi:hypothetical protein